MAGGTIDFEGHVGVANIMMQPFHSPSTAIYCARARVARHCVRARRAAFNV
jgi:hypothetical protein